ncbi:voltage-gated hydrogen channel 1-like [Physella acuta]|uniref:voltage-gated hydrogen channel 1-like n=1 Tax=Physella acuta TaxID=109671 RepID=UPI0027DBD869|nr:voltage-gated hydrogen channel 1-like [Physella acuta]
MDKGGGQEVTLLEMGGNNGVHKDKHLMRLERKKMEGGMLQDDRTPDEDREDESLNDVLDDDASDDSSSVAESHHSHVLDPNSCKGKLAAYLKTNVVQYFVIFLVVADCVIIVLELLLDMEIIKFPEASHEPDNSTSHNVTHGHTDEHAHGHTDDHKLVVWNSSLESYNSTHNISDGHATPHHHTNKEKAEHVLHALSLAILSLFMIEVSLKVFIEGKHLLKQPAEVFDAIVVIVSFTLDVVFSFISVASAAQDAAGLMVLLRLWRVTRIINGVILSVKLDAKKKIDVMKRALRHAEHENKRLQHKVDKLERENGVLRGKRMNKELSGDVGHMNKELSGDLTIQSDTQNNCLFENNMHEIELRDLSDKT